MLSPIALNIGSDAMWDYSKYVFERAAGQEARVTEPAAVDRVEDARGNTEAVINNVRPHLSAAHDRIGAGANNIIVVSGSGNSIVFNSDSKKYIQNETIDPQIRRKSVGVGGLNANSRFGKVFDYELGHLVTIEVARDTNQDAMIVLNDGVGSYIRGNRGPTVQIKFLVYLDYQGRPSKYLILDAQPLDN